MVQRLIEAWNLEKTHHRHKVLDGVGLSIAPGEILTVIGPNGSGKTTLLKILLGLEQPDAGSVRRREGLRIGYMPQRLNVSPVLPMTVQWFLEQAANDFHVGERAAKVTEALAEVGASHLLSHPMRHLSGGETQRVLLARALLRRPELLVLDEPAQGVDINGQAELYAVIAKVSKAHHCAVLMVSHDIHLVMASTHNVLCLNHHICCHGSPVEVSRDPSFAALFGPHMAKSLALYVHHHDHEHTLGGEIKNPHGPGGEAKEEHHHG